MSEIVEYQTHDLMCDHDLDGRIVAANAALARLLEISVDDLCAMTLGDMLTDRARPLLDRYFEAIRRNGVAGGLMELRTASGRVRIVEYQNATVTDFGGGAVVRGLARDVTDREEALRVLRTREQQFRCIIENVSDIIGVIHPSGRLQYHSPAAERVLGYAANELTAQRVSRFVHADDLDRANEFFEQRCSPAAAPRAIDLRIRHSDGSWRWLSVMASTVVRHGKTTAVVINCRDITDRMLLEAQLEQANRLNGLGRLAATVAHEFNNVLMGIQPFADLMRRPGVSPATIAKGAEHISNSIARGKRVTLDILRFTNAATPALVPVDVNEWWRQLAPEMQASSGNGIELVAELSPDLTMLADAAQVSQIFANLISNARDAMPYGGTLRLSARRGREGETFPFGVVPGAGQFVIFSVEDTGTGMAENVLLHAFDPLFTTKRNGGTGLGLAVAHQVVQRHRGFIFAESTPGAGSTFHVFIPATEAAHATPEAPEAANVRLWCERMLVVDDEPAILDGISGLLRDSGSAIQTAATGESAIDCARQFHPDMAVVDIRLPDVDGFEVARRIRAANPEVKILFASGHGAAAAGPYLDEHTGFIQKPFEIDALFSAITALNDRKAA